MHLRRASCKIFRVAKQYFRKGGEGEGYYLGGEEKRIGCYPGLPTQINLLIQV